MNIEEAISLIRKEVGQCDVTAMLYSDHGKTEVSLYVYRNREEHGEPDFHVIWGKSVEQAYRAIIEQVRAATEARVA